MLVFRLLLCTFCPHSLQHYPSCVQPAACGSDRLAEQHGIGTIRQREQRVAGIQKPAPQQPSNDTASLQHLRHPHHNYHCRRRHHHRHCHRTPLSRRKAKDSRQRNLGVFLPFRNSFRCQHQGGRSEEELGLVRESLLGLPGEVLAGCTAVRLARRGPD